MYIYIKMESHSQTMNIPVAENLFHQNGFQLRVTVDAGGVSSISRLLD